MLHVWTNVRSNSHVFGSTRPVCSDNVRLPDINLSPANAVSVSIKFMAILVLDNHVDGVALQWCTCFIINDSEAVCSGAIFKHLMM